MNADLADLARGLIPGGVSSPARAFGAVGGEPLFAERGEGAYLYDSDGEAYIDYIQGFGSVLLGHAHEAVVEAVVAAAERGGAFGLSTAGEVRLASLVTRSMPSIEKIRFLTSGTEAAMTAARLARAATGRNLIVKFEGCYHGHADVFLAAAGSGVATFGIAAAAGVPAGAVVDTAILPLNDVEAFATLCATRGDEVAAVFVEPVAANMGVVLPSADFLLALRRATTELGAILVFDEVVTGFRLGAGGAQGAFGMTPDLTMLGKVIGGGLPVGAVGGPAALMDELAPVGPVYQAGTFAAHPHAMSAGAAVLNRLEDYSFKGLEETATVLADGLTEAAASAGCEATVVRAGTILSVFFRAGAPRDFSEVQSSDREAFARFHRALRQRGVLIPPSPFEAWFPSLAHSAPEIERTCDAAVAAFAAAALG